MELARDAGTVFDFHGRRALVTGGESGIARATALLLGALGADVAMASLGEGLDVTADEIRGYGRQVHTTRVDLSDPEECRRVVDEAADVLGGLDAVVNAAGGSHRSSTYDGWSVEDWNQLVTRNLSIAFFVTQAAVPHLEAAGGGAIVSISSSASIYPVPAVTPYGAAKAGINNLTMTLARELGPRGVRINAVAPGPTKAGRTWRTLTDGGREPTEEEMRTTSLGRMADVEEQAWPIVFLLSDAAGFITGTTLHVDGAHS